MIHYPKLKYLMKTGIPGQFYDAISYNNPNPVPACLLQWDNIQAVADCRTLRDFTTAIVNFPNVVNTSDEVFQFLKASPEIKRVSRRKKVKTVKQSTTIQPDPSFEVLRNAADSIMMLMEIKDMLKSLDDKLFKKNTVQNEEPVSQC